MPLSALPGKELQFLLEGASTSMLVVERTGSRVDLLWWNRAFADAFGFEAFQETARATLLGRAFPNDDGPLSSTASTHVEVACGDGKRRRARAVRAVSGAWELWTFELEGGAAGIVVALGENSSASGADAAVSTDNAVASSKAAPSSSLASREIDAKMRMILTAAQLGLWEWDVQKDVIIWDDALCKVWGVTRETAPCNWAAYAATIHPDDVSMLSETIKGAIESGEYSVVGHRIVRPDGSVRHIRARAAVMRDALGRVKTFIGSARDVTEDVLAEAQRRESQKLAAIGQLSAGVAHNFNNMLMGILPNIELALREVAPETKELLTAARDSTLRARDMVRQLTTFAGRTKPGERKSEAIRGIVERTVGMCRRAFDASIDLRTTYPNEALYASINANEVEQALLNVLLNARDAVMVAAVNEPRVLVEVTRASGSDPALTTLALLPDQSYVVVRIDDNGEGIEESVRQRIFEPFFTTKDVGMGTGLGLSTALTIVKEHGGAIECLPRSEGGTRFAFYLPERVADRKSIAPALADVTAKGDETILVVDDEATVRTIVRRVLERGGYKVVLASSGDEALRRMEDDEMRNSVSLVVLDLSMPGMPGVTVREHLRALCPKTPVVYFSGYAIKRTDDVDGLIEKPILPKELLESVRQVLDRAAARNSSD